MLIFGVITIVFKIKRKNIFRDMKVDLKTNLGTYIPCI